jgi:hypothetical protein
MDINQVYEIMKYAIRKNQNGNLNPDSFGLVINQAQWSYTDYLLGSFQKYTPGRPWAAVEFGQNEDVRQRLSPFIPTPVTLSIDVNGRSSYPAGYLNSDAMWYGIYKRRVKYIQQDRIDSHLNSYIDPIATNPVYLIDEAGFQFYPTNLGTAQLSYIKQPDSLVWGYTNDIYGRPIYNPGTSVQPQWLDLDMLQIIVRALAIVGVNLQLNVVEQYSQLIKAGGQ